MEGKTLVLGVGNTLMADEGLGVAVVDRLEGLRDEGLAALDGVTLLDGGTMGLALLPEIELAQSLVIVDAAQLKASPGTIQVFQGKDMDEFLRRRGRSPHDIGLDDLMDGLILRDRVPPRRALVGIQPESLEAGMPLSETAAKAVPRAADAVMTILSAWV